jgi:hypothetical protein
MGLEPATSGVTGRRWQLREGATLQVRRLRGKLLGRSRAPFGTDRDRPCHRIRGRSGADHNRPPPTQSCSVLVMKGSVRVRGGFPSGAKSADVEALL